ncbi:MAG TPA: HEAT repeat domain-containing protein [Allosphingosinicella sp.]|nr:HEAT repeat domain-containing protein [Allosphingosinicella sp.]
MDKQLQDLLTDRARLAETRRSIQAFARGWGADPIQQRFRDAIAGLPEKTGERLAELAHGLLADSAWVDTLIDSLCGELRADPLFAPPLPVLATEILKGLLVYDSAELSVAASVISLSDLAAKKSKPRGPTSVNFPGTISVIRFVRSGGARLSFWEAPRIDGEFTKRGAGRCRRVGERLIADGEVITMDGRSQSYVIERARGNLVLVHAEIKTDQAPLVREYDSASGDFLACSAADDRASRVQLVATLIRKLDPQRAFEPIADQLDHGEFFVRWHAMKELLGIDTAAALPHLKRMAARDPHPDVRRAARSVLDGLAVPSRSKAA